MYYRLAVAPQAAGGRDNLSYPDRVHHLCDSRASLAKAEKRICSTGADLFPHQPSISLKLTHQIKGGLNRVSLKALWDIE